MRDGETVEVVQGKRRHLLGIMRRREVEVVQIKRPVVAVVREEVAVMLRRSNMLVTLTRKRMKMKKMKGTIERRRRKKKKRKTKKRKMKERKVRKLSWKNAVE